MSGRVIQRKKTLINKLKKTELDLARIVKNTARSSQYFPINLSD